MTSPAARAAFRDRHRARLNAERNAFVAENKERLRPYWREQFKKRMADPVKKQLIVRQLFARNLKYYYNLTVEDVARQLNKQDRKCLSCEDPLDMAKNTHVDHCHTTGRFRGMLCNYCNNAVGQVKEDVKRLHCVLAYIESWGL